MKAGCGTGIRGVILVLILITAQGWWSVITGQGGENLRNALITADRLEREEKWVEARELYLEIGYLFPRDRNVLYGLERVHQNIVDDGRYRAFLRDNFERYPRDSLIFKQYLNLSAQTEEMETIRQAVQPQHLILLARLKIDEGDLAGAFEVLRELAEVDPEMGTVELSGFVRVCEERSVYKEGVKAYRLLSELDPERKVSFDLKSADLHRMGGQPEEAEQIYREMLDTNPDPLTAGRISFSLGEIALYDRGRPKKALDWFRRVIESGAGADLDVKARIAIIETLVYLGDFDEAMDESEKVEFPSVEGDLEIEKWFFQGIVMILAGRIEEGRETLEKVSKRASHFRANDAIEALIWIEKDPSTDYAVARGLIEMKLISRIGDDKRSLTLLKSLRESASETPLVPDIIYYQARGYRAADRFDDAILLLEEIKTLFPDHRLVPIAEWEMADILWRHLGEREMARESLERIILDHSDSIIAPKARKDLEKLAR